ncbi:ribosomal protein L24e-domain-containing protein [Pelagophyceae sp. CCMP2097]|nr:ribosomal protein L24e-domain-containing protein [Pelagophyceae sp. CCMP2097]|mmetsp:Transcript_31522/g.106142  ORF Transcript_31522/g.106142 Transcript_31522/m.106142 type:complete len:159 (-) Transcript_31522:62-538(-)
MRIGKCHFCSSPIYPGHGIAFARNDAKLFHFCRSKCHKNFNLKRNPRKVRWTKAFRKVHGKEMTVDSTFDLEKRRNRPIKYDRDIVGTTLRAMQRAGEIQSKRALIHHKNRMSEHKLKAAERARVEIKKSIELIQPALVQRETASVAQKDMDLEQAKA